MSDELKSLQRQLAEAEANLRLIKECKAAYVLTTDVPLQLIKEEQAALGRISDLTAHIQQLCQDSAAGQAIPQHVRKKVLLLRLAIGVALLLTFGLLIVLGGPGVAHLVGSMWRTATPLAFAPASGDESLIIVAHFADHSAGAYAGVDPDQYIYRALTDRIARDGLRVRVERLAETLDATTVRQAGAAYSATLVLWGQYDQVGITPYVERIKDVGTARTDEEGQSVLIDPERIQFSVVTDLPAMSSYLVLYTLGFNLGANQQWDEAIDYLTSAIAAIPEGETTAKPDEAYFARGIVYRELENDEAALLDYAQAIALEYQPLSWPYNNRGAVYHARQEYDRALADYEQAIQLDSTLALAYYNRGTVYYNLKDHNRALSDYTRAIAFAPKYAPAYGNRGTVYYVRQDYDRALADYTQAIALAPQGAHAYSNRGNVYAALKEYARALADYERAIELDPKDATAYSNRGIVYDALKDYDRAIADYTQAIALAPTFVAPYVSRGTVYANHQDYDRAIADYTQAIAFAPTFAAAYRNRGLAHQRLGNTEQAIADYEQVLRLSNDPEWRTFAEQQLASLRNQ